MLELRYVSIILRLRIAILATLCAYVNTKKYLFMKIKKITLNNPLYPEKLRQIPDFPKEFYCLGEDLESLFNTPSIAIVGSRKATPYGQLITDKLAGELANKGIVVISGLALGVDGIAHKAVIKADGKTIAVLPCGLDRIYPSSHHNLAKDILNRGGVLISEYPEGTAARRENFIARNRIVSGLSDGLLITEAAEKSGTLHTANFALEQGREVMAVPGNITSPLSVGTNNLIKIGATPITSVGDILNTLGIEDSSVQQELIAGSEEESIILELLKSGVSIGDELLALSRLEPSVFSQTLTMLEITGKAKPLGADQWTLL